MPANATLDLFKYFVPEGTIDYAYQNLVGARFVDETTGKPIDDKTIDIKVTKVWKDAEGNVLKESPTSAYIRLFANGEEVDNATLSDGGSATDSHVFENMQSGLNYTIKEDEVEGFDAIITSDAENGFTITNQEKVGPYKIIFSKRNIFDEELAGAVLELKDAHGEIVETWTSSTTPHEIELKTGKYTLTEKSAPEGYEVAKDIPFEVENIGTVFSPDNVGVEGDTVLIYNKLIPQETPGETDTETPDETEKETPKETETEVETPVETDVETPKETETETETIKETETEKETDKEVVPGDSNNKPGTPSNGRNPNTGDNFSTIIYIGLAAVAVAGLVILKKKKLINRN